MMEQRQEMEEFLFGRLKGRKKWTSESSDTPDQTLGQVQISIMEGRNFPFFPDKEQHHHQRQHQHQCRHHSRLRPGVELQIGKNKVRTQSLSDALSPTWLANFILPVPHENSNLEISLINAEQGQGQNVWIGGATQDVWLGGATVSMADMMLCNKTKVQWIPMVDHHGKVVGEIYLALKYSKRQIASNSVPGASSTSSPEMDDNQNGLKALLCSRNPSPTSFPNGMRPYPNPDPTSSNQTSEGRESGGSLDTDEAAAVPPSLPQLNLSSQSHSHHDYHKREKRIVQSWGISHLTTRNCDLQAPDVMAKEMAKELAKEALGEQAAADKEEDLEDALSMESGSAESVDEDEEWQQREQQLQLVGSGCYVRGASPCTYRSFTLPFMHMKLLMEEHEAASLLAQAAQSHHLHQRREQQRCLDLPLARTLAEEMDVDTVLEVERWSLRDTNGGEAEVKVEDKGGGYEYREMSLALPFSTQRQFKMVFFAAGGVFATVLAALIWKGKERVSDD